MVQERDPAKPWRVVLATLALVASSAGVAQAQGAQVTGNADSSTPRYGVVGHAYYLDGVQGASTGADYADNGVTGATNSTDTIEAGVFAYNTGSGPGVYGRGFAADTGYGLRGYSGDAHGVYGLADSLDIADYGGYFTGPQGVYGTTTVSDTDAVTANCESGGYCWAVDAYSSTSYALHAITDDPDNNYGLYTPDNIYSLNYHTAGGLSLIVRNVPDTVLGATSLEPGEVVALAGMAPPPPGSDRPVAQVTRADWTATGGLIGVVETAYEITMVDRPRVTFVKREFPSPEGGEPDVLWVPQRDEEHQVAVHRSVDGPVPPGGYAVVRVLGLAQVKVAALTGQVLPGDALRVASVGGPAVLSNEMGAEGAPVVARALETVPAGTTGLVWAVVGAR